ncbi:Protein-export membrane protein SecD [uncultured archaeon]|nr:Protein-export membrane protein SecD [uncultured archaeon]
MKLPVNIVLKSLQVRFALIITLLSLLLASNIPRLNPDQPIGFGNGLDYGLDFVGGTQLQLRLENQLDASTMAVEKGILESRLNSFGLKDIPVRPWGDQYIIVQVAGLSPGQLGQIEDILRRQARFEERIDGQLAVLGDEITVDLKPTGTQIGRTTSGYEWAVSVIHTKEGACRFGEVGSGKFGRPVDIYIDRPVNTTILFSSGTYLILGNISSVGTQSDIYYGGTALDVLENRSAIPVVAYDGDINATLKQLLELKKAGFYRVIMGDDEDHLPESIRNYVADSGFVVERKTQGNKTYEEWIQDLTGLQSSPRLNFDTKGECVYNAQITGGATTIEAARAEVQKNQVLLTSGNLPAKLAIESRTTTPPTLGYKFLRYSFFTAIIGFITVGLVLLIRYRQPVIVIPIMIAGFCEIIIILGAAAIINWNLDLPAIAGIIAAVGTGVDNQIVITDETLKKGKMHEKIINVGERIRRAIFIIMVSAATMISAMLPLLSIGAGMLKGFAFTTTLGVLLGVFITRPAYAKTIEILVKNR